MSSIVDKLNLPCRIEEDFIFLKDENKSYTYNEFMKKTVYFASILAENGWKNRAVAVRASHTADTIISFVSILLSGNYYVALSTEAPEAFISRIKEQVTFEIFPEIPEDGIARFSDTDLRCRYEELAQKRQDIKDEDPLYLVFTSGSTGIPKGIVKSHENMWDFIQAYDKEFSFDSETVLGNQAPFYFDASAKDIYLSLYKKCRMVVIDTGLFMKPKELVEYLNREQITVIQWVPSALSIVASLGTFDLVKPVTLQQVFFVGEKFPVKHLRVWMNALLDTRFINLYGSSEMAGICAFCVLDREEIMNMEEIPIGNALSNSSVFLWDAEGQKCITEKGKSGEIRVRSRALARGYLGDKEQSREVFLRESEGICFCTGDSACYDEKGRLVFVGRKDFQIKHMGHRIELEEIETAVLQSTFITDACCIYHKNKIQLFVCGEVDKAQLTTELRERIPEYMLPNKITILDEIPVNANGKKDRGQLQKLSERRKRWKK